jgi:uncharacterized protein YjiS (DUF1127 family)
MIVRKILSFFKMIEDAKRFRDTYEQLYRMSDKQLQDIGLDRDMIKTNLIENTLNKTH